jgi:hypothetical protein
MKAFACKKDSRHESDPAVAACCFGEEPGMFCKRLVTSPKGIQAFRNRNASPDPETAKGDRLNLEPTKIEMQILHVCLRTSARLFGHPFFAYVLSRAAQFIHYCPVVLLEAFTESLVYSIYF